MKNATTPVRDTEATTLPPRTAKVTLGGETHELKWSMWSLYALEELTSLPCWVVMSEIKSNYKRAGVRLVWACLQHEPDPPTIKDVGMWLPADGSADAIFEAAVEVFRANMPKAAEEDAEEESAGPLGDEAAA